MRDDAGKNRGLVAFFILTYAIMALTWGSMAVCQMEGASTNPDAPAPSSLAFALVALGGFSPSIAGVLVTWRVEGRVGLRDLWRRATRFNLGWKWYGAIFLLPVLSVGLGVAVYLLRGGELVDSPLLLQPLNLVGFTFLIFLGGPLSEELGWRGFALGRLLARWNPFRASLVLGVLWSLWHIPLFFIPGMAQQQYGDPVPEFVVFALTIVAQSIVYTWLYMGTGRSVWAAILYHAVSNYLLSFLATMTNGGVVERLAIGCVCALAAALIVVRWRRTHGQLVPA